MKKIIAMLLLSLVFVGISFGELGGKVYKVEKIGGVPTITENGKPVRSRMFWANANGQVRLDFKEGWNEGSFSFVAPEDSDRVAIHFRLGEKPAEFWISKVNFTDETAGAPQKAFRFDGALDPSIWFWCAGKGRNPPLSMGSAACDGAPALNIKIGADDKTEKLDGLHFIFDMLEAKKGHKYRVDFKIKASKYVEGGVTAHNQGGKIERWGTAGKSLIEGEYKMAGDVGVDFATIMLNSVWAEGGKEPDYSHIDRIFRIILDNNPKAKIIPRIKLYPPEWWMEKYKAADVMRRADGSLNMKYASITSEQYRKDCIESLKKFIAYCEKNYPENMAGYHPAGGNTQEWFYGDSWNPEFAGYDTSTLAAWRAWLVQKYKTPENLKKAWRDSAASFETAAVPSAAERGNLPHLLDPSKFQKVIDFNLFRQDAMADVVMLMAKTVREATDGRRLVVFFYGYQLEFSGMATGPASSGHYALEKVLKSPDIDIVCGPISYRDRKFGEGKSTMGTTESVMLSGKIWLDEDDTSTYLAGKEGSYPGIEKTLTTRKDTIQVLRRNLAQETLRNFGAWWMDLGGSGWFHDEKLWRQMELFEPVERDFLKYPTPYLPEMAIVVGEKSACYVGAMRKAGEAYAPIMSGARVSCNRTGVPFGQYILGDVLEGRASPKLNLFVSAYALNSAERAKIRAISEKSGAIFAWAPALVDADKGEFSLAAVKEATGFSTKLSSSKSAWARATKEGAAAGLPEGFGSSAKIEPLLSPVPEKGDTVLAAFENGDPAVVLRMQNGVPAIFCAAPELPPQLVRLAAKLSGVHIYTDDPATIYANGGYISVVALADADIRIRLKTPRAVYDALKNTRIGEGAGITLKMRLGEMRLLRLGRGNEPFEKAE